MVEAIDEEKFNFAKILKSEDYNNLSLKDLTYFTTDYIIRCVEGHYQGRQIRLRELGNEFVIGNAEESDLCIKYSDLDEKHCKLKYIENTIYYTLEDLESKTGTWKKISNLEDSFEVIHDNVEFRFFNHRFIIEKKEDGHYLTFTQTCPSNKHTSKKINDSFLSIGKEACVINLDDLKCSENHRFMILKHNDRVFVINDTEEVTNEGLFYRLRKDEVGLLRAGDIFKIGETSFRILNHNWGITTELGDKSRQEDKFCIIDDLRIFDEIIVPCYAVYDGHAGPACSVYLQKHFHRNLREIIIMKNLKESKNFLPDFISAVQEAIIYTDIAFSEFSPFSPYQGSTCVMLFFIANKVICCNLGDSVAILYKNDDQTVYLSKDFKPSRPKELERVKTKNGFVSNDGRLLGLISVSRGFGDWRFKDPKNPKNVKKMEVNVTYDEYLMSNRAEFRIFDINPLTCEYIIVVSDGIFQHTAESEVFNIINHALKYDKQELNNSLINVNSAADNVRLEIINRIYSNKQKKNKISTDNMTLILVHLNNN